MAEDPLPVCSFASAQEMDDWLLGQPDDCPGLWLKLAKKASGIPCVGYVPAVEVAIRHGWIDGLKRPLDQDYWLQRFTPRRARSPWSALNRERAERLIAERRMLPAGLRQVEAARADGRWDAAYQGQRSISEPDDLRAALDAAPAARAFFDQLNSRNRYAILYRVQDAKRPATRASRIEQYVLMCAQGRRPYP